MNTHDNEVTLVDAHIVIDMLERIAPKTAIDMRSLLDKGTESPKFVLRTIAKRLISSIEKGPSLR